MNSPEADYTDQSNFKLSDFMVFDEWLEEEDLPFLASGSFEDRISPATDVAESAKSSSHHEETSSRNQVISGHGGEKMNNEDIAKVAFKTKSDYEILDDGFKWRKYGKKMVKNSPNPRNYYRCSVEGCPVKKRVERDGEDPRYVITTYEGIHNHLSPSL